MADKSQQLVLEALQRVAAEPAGLPVFASKSAAGLFPTNAAGKQAAQHCQQEGFLRAVRSETRGKTTLEICTLSEKGLAFLLQQVNPRQILEGFVASLENRQQQLDALVQSAQASQQSLAELGDVARKVLEQLDKPRLPTHGSERNGHAGPDPRETALLEHLRTWQSSTTLGDCPLPQLFRSVGGTAAGWTIGQFHDQLRGLHEKQLVYLHPWTGPLYEVPEPALALLIGHEVAYYASLRA